MARLMGRLDALDLIAAGVGDGEILSQDEEMWYSVPTGADAEAIEVDVDPDSRTPFYVWTRRWDRTGGMSHEIEIGAFATADEAVLAVKKTLADIAERDARLEALLATEPTD